MSIANFLKKLAGHAGKASRGKRGASSHVNTAVNKQHANKAVRDYDRDFYEDHHLDVPDELARQYQDDL